MDGDVNVREDKTTKKTVTTDKDNDNEKSRVEEMENPVTMAEE